MGDADRCENENPQICKAEEAGRLIRSTLHDTEFAIYRYGAEQGLKGADEIDDLLHNRVSEVDTPPSGWGFRNPHPTSPPASRRALPRSLARRCSIGVTFGGPRKTEMAPNQDRSEFCSMCGRQNRVLGL